MPVIGVRAYKWLLSFFNGSIGKVHTFILFIHFIFLFKLQKFPSYWRKNEAGTHKAL